MGDFREKLPLGFDQFSKDADFLWECILNSGHGGSDQKKFLDALKNAIAYLNSLSLAQVKIICVEGDMAEKVSMIVDLKDYAYEPLLNEWNQGV